MYSFTLITAVAFGIFFLLTALVIVTGHVLGDDVDPHVGQREADERGPGDENMGARIADAHR